MAALWLLATDLIGQISPHLSNANNTAEAPPRSQRAYDTASIGYIRGDLWAEYARTLASELQVTKPSASALALDSVRRAAERAVRLAPINAAVWLILAETDLRQSDTKTSSEALKMSYYTGPNDLSLIPDRLRLATQTKLSDPELQMIVGDDIRTILLFRPDLRPALISAYRGASAQGKSSIDVVVQSTDPSFLASLHGDALPQ